LNTGLHALNNKKMEKKQKIEYLATSQMDGTMSGWRHWTDEQCE